MFIISQDRDIMIQRAGDLYSEAVISDSGELWGYNLMHQGFMLGTFDTYGEIIAEILRIEQCTDDVYYVSGYCNEGDPDSVLEAILMEVDGYEVD